MNDRIAAFVQLILFPAFLALAGGLIAVFQAVYQTGAWAKVEVSDVGAAIRFILKGK